MKKYLFYFFALGFIALTACQDQITETYTVNEPVYMSYDALRSSFNVKSAEVIIQPGKIYFKDNYIFVNEYMEGIHMIDNSDPVNPQTIVFVEIPGNVDMAIKGNMLYADSYVDLLTIDISDPNNIVEVDRDTNAFPYIIPGFELGMLGEIDVNKGVIVGYEKVIKTEKVTGDNTNFWRFNTWESSMAMDASSSKGGSGDTGTGGSMARFTLYDNYLYAIDNASLHLFNVSNNANPNFEKQVPISWNIETLFPYEEKLFIGSQTGMFIYSLQNPSNPEFISQFWHASSCDPVVVEGNYAYVTLRGGNLCGAIESQLDVIDLSIIEDPTLIATYLMEEPYGLGIDDGTLFVCDGPAGLKIYDATDPMKIDSNLIVNYSDIDAFDVIPLGDILIMIGIDGLYQYDYSSLDDIRLLSHIPIYDN